MAFAHTQKRCATGVEDIVRRALVEDNSKLKWNYLLKLIGILFILVSRIFQHN